MIISCMWQERKKSNQQRIGNQKQRRRRSGKTKFFINTRALEDNTFP